MDHASATNARINWVDSAVRSLFSRGASHVELSANPRVTSLSRFFSVFYWAGLLKSETVLRRAIPFLIITLLLMVAAARTVVLMSTASETARTTNTEISLLSKLVTLELNTNPSLEQAIASPTLAEGFLKEALSAIAMEEYTSVLVVNADGRIIAQKSQLADAIGEQLSDVTSDNIIDKLSSKTSAPHRFTFRDEISMNGYLTALKTSDEKALGHLLVANNTTLIYATWRQTLKLNIILFLATSSVMLVILYAYFSQGIRAREADTLFMETNARFDTALARGHCGLWDWDLSRGRIVWSRSMFEMLGMEPTNRVMGYGELAGLLHAEDADLMLLANSAFNTQQPQIDHRFRIMHASGTWVWLRLRAELVRYKGADPHLIGIAVDITEQEALKQQSRDADIRLRDAIENISEAFVLWDSKKRLVMCNSKYQQLYNLPASTVTSGAAYADVMAQSRKPRIRTQISLDGSSENGSKTYEAQIEDGNWLQINERRTQDGGFVSVGTDITQIKRNEAKMMDSERKLMATIADLRASQRQLEYQAQKLVELADDLSDQKDKAEAGNRSKSEFLANISHELRTPLNAVIGFSDIMRSKMFGPLGSEKYVEYAEDIHHSGNFLLGVINDVLDMSKIEAGRFELNPEEVELHTLLDETLRIIHMQAEDAGLSVKQNIPENLTLEADRRAVKQIMLNLLSNAVKFTPKGGTVEVSAKLKKSAVNIVIRDNGIGISPEALERLGRPFEQVQDQFTKDHKGSGLGLAIAKSLATLHGGSFKIESTEGEGTKVFVNLPLKCRKENAASEDDSIAA